MDPERFKEIVEALKSCDALFAAANFFIPSAWRSRDATEKANSIA